MADETIRTLQQEVEALKKALELYAHCRHAEQNCCCTLEARAALYPYIVKERAAAASHLSCCAASCHWVFLETQA
jgi:hypothetical protein